MNKLINRLKIKSASILHFIYMLQSKAWLYPLLTLVFYLILLISIYNKNFNYINQVIHPLIMDDTNLNNILMHLYKLITTKCLIYIYIKLYPQNIYLEFAIDYIYRSFRTNIILCYHLE